MKNKHISTYWTRDKFDHDGRVYILHFEKWVIQHWDGNQYGYDEEKVDIWDEETGEDATMADVVAAAHVYLTDYHSGDDRGAHG